MTEVELCSAIKASNLFPGFALHEEVGISSCSCDMVFENGEEVYTVEAKTELNFKVIAQAIRWQRVATISYIAIPKSCCKSWHESPKKNVIEALGLGIIWVDDENTTKSIAKFNPRHDPFEKFGDWFESSLYKFPADLDFWRECFERIGGNGCKAGSKIGDRSTPFKRTVEALRIEAGKHPEYTLKQLLTLVPTHYSSVASAEGALKRYAEKGIIQKFWR